MYYFATSAASIFLALLFGYSMPPAGKVGRKPKQQVADTNVACMTELRVIQSTLLAIADTTTKTQVAELTDKNLALVGAMLVRLKSPVVHLGTQWLSTFQDLRIMLQLSGHNQQQTLTRLHKELESKLKDGGKKRPGQVVQVIDFEELSTVTVHGVSTSNYKPTYRIIYVRGSERGLPQHKFEVLCKTDNTGCLTQLTPCFYLFWAVDVDSNHICSDSASIQVKEGKSEKFDLHIRKLQPAHHGQ